MNIDIIFNDLPLGAISDNLYDTICYSELIQKITNYSQTKHFNLIENFTLSVQNLIRNILSSKRSIINSIKVITHKMPQIDNLHGGVSFSYQYKEDEINDLY